MKRRGVARKETRKRRHKYNGQSADYWSMMKKVAKVLSPLIVPFPLVALKRLIGAIRGYGILSNDVSNALSIYGNWRIVQIDIFREPIASSVKTALLALPGVDPALKNRVLYHVYQVLRLVKGADDNDVDFHLLRLDKDEQVVVKKKIPGKDIEKIEIRPTAFLTFAKYI